MLKFFCIVCKKIFASNLKFEGVLLCLFCLERFNKHIFFLNACYIVLDEESTIVYFRITLTRL